MAEAAQRFGRLPFALAIFLGAFLLFQVQPLIAKFILPWFGGSAGVWTTCMLFFQALLLGGYAYAHLSINALRPRTQAAVHVLLAAAALAMLPIVPAERWKPPGPEMPILRILLLLTMTLGLPYFVLSATAPLLQAWFARVNPGRSPYRLYALSNFASLLALLSYPFVFEPLVSGRTHAVGWSVAMGVFVVIVAGCAVVVWRGVPVQNGEHQASHGSALTGAHRLNEGTGAPLTRIGPSRWMLWLALPACGSLLLLATTNVISQEIAVVPFLWVLPLALYLLTFVIAFDSPRWYARTIFGPLFIVALAAVVWVMMPAVFGHDEPMIVSQIAIYTGVMFICCMVCHGEVARLKPDPRQLTSFYLCIALGGAIGGFLVAVGAPLLLKGYHELHTGLFFCALLFMMVLFIDPASRFHRGGERLGWYAMILGLVLLGLTLRAHATRKVQGTVALERHRSFYGVLTVYEQRPGRGLPQSRLLQHGTITHGEQLLAPEMHDHATTYYGRESGVGQILTHSEGERPPRRIGAVGLGVGTIATYLRRGDVLRFYEIDPHVERLARQYFTFLDDTQGTVEMVLGDARLSMEREADQRYDVLVLDAFSGDAIPVHLLTREAMALYLRHLEPNGIIAIHISNQHLDLAPVVARLAAEVQMSAVTVAFEGSPAVAEYDSVWAILSRDTQLLGEALSSGVNVLVAVEDAPLWTDDYSSLFPLLR